MLEIRQLIKKFGKLPAPTSHVITPFIFFNPKFAHCAHLEFLSNNEIFEFHIILVPCICDLKFFATLILMVHYTAIKAISII